MSGLLLGGPAVPAEPPDALEDEALQERLRRQSERIESLETRLRQLEEMSRNGSQSIKLRGRLQADAWTVGGDPPGAGYPGGADMRSARLGVEGRLSLVLRYVLEADFAGNRVSLKNAYLEYRDSPQWALQAGNLKPHVSLENRTGLHQVTFMERALPNALAISQEVLGAAFVSHGGNWSLGAGVFGEGPGTQLDGNEGYGLAARFTHAPWLDDEIVMHWGASGYYKDLGSAGEEFRLRQRPESYVFGTRLLDTGILQAESMAVAGVELAGVAGSLSLQAEYLRSRLELAAADDAIFDGHYAYLSWFATGESRPYSNASGKFGAVRPRRPLGDGGWGALELALRYSSLDLSDGSVLGGKGENLSLGATWYLSEHARLLLNWVHFDVDGSVATLPFGQASHRGDAFGLRVQATW